MLAASAMRPDVIHAHDLMSPTSIAVACSRGLGAPVVAKVLSTGVDGDIDRLLRKPLGRRRVDHVAEHVDAFVSLSGEVEAELRGYGVAAERVHDIPNGVDAGHFRPARDAGERAAVRRALGIPGDAVLTLYCGRLRDVKRLDVLVEAFRQLPGHLLMVGDGPEEHALRAMALAPELAGRVHLLDTVDEPAPYYRAADIYASASQTEGMSGSVLEAMATGLAIVASPASGMQELIGGGAGLIADDLSAEALARVLGDAVRDAELRARLGDAARRRAIERYSLEATADRLMALYRALTVAA
jgi:glycosyltransferase involved in cell wall biosynthesis